MLMLAGLCHLRQAAVLLTLIGPQASTVHWLLHGLQPSKPQLISPSQLRMAETAASSIWARMTAW